MTDPKIYALLAAGSYWDIRSFSQEFDNRAPTPEGWTVLKHYDTSYSGNNSSTFGSVFSARVYQNNSTEPKGSASHYFPKLRTANKNATSPTN
jgi:hypothetical protein